MEARHIQRSEACRRPRLDPELVELRAKEKELSRDIKRKDHALKAIYIASESTFYKVLKEKKLLEHRGKSKKQTHNRPAPLVALGPNQIYSWDITNLRSTIAGKFNSRKIVGQEFFEVESMEFSSAEFVCAKEYRKSN